LENYKISEEKFPSPADYSIILPNYIEKTPVFRSRLPDLAQKNKDKIPGVGEYNLETRNTKIIPVKFAREVRSCSPKNRNEKIPGPGAYFPLLLQKQETPVFLLQFLFFLHFYFYFSQIFHYFFI